MNRLRQSFTLHHCRSCCPTDIRSRDLRLLNRSTQRSDTCRCDALLSGREEDSFGDHCCRDVQRVFSGIDGAQILTGTVTGLAHLLNSFGLHRKLNNGPFKSDGVLHIPNRASTIKLVLLLSALCLLDLQADQGITYELCCAMACSTRRLIAK